MSSTLPPLHFNEAFLSWFRERTEAAWSGYPAITLNTYPRLEVYDWQQGTHWLPGLTEAEITAIEKRWNVPFPPDYRLFLSRLHAPDRLLAGVFKNDDGTLELDYDHSFFNWQADERVIQGCSDVLVDGLLWKKPEEVKRAERPHLQKVVQAAPKLIPINGNRYLLAEPCPVPGRIDSERSKPERDQRHGSETQTVRPGVQIQSGDGELPARDDTGRGLPEIGRLFFHAQSVEASLPAARS